MVSASVEDAWRGPVVVRVWIHELGRRDHRRTVHQRHFRWTVVSNGLSVGALLRCVAALLYRCAVLCH